MMVMRKERKKKRNEMMLKEEGEKKEKGQLMTFTEISERFDRRGRQLLFSCISFVFPIHICIVLTLGFYDCTCRR